MKYAWSNVFEDPFWITTIPMAIIGWVVALVGSILNNVSYASQFPVFSWWGVAFELVSILLTLHAAFSNEIRMYRLSIIGCLAISTVYTTNSTNNFVWRDNSSSGTAAAGNILLSIINLVWILFFGTTQDEPIHAYIDSFAAHKKMLPTNFQKRIREKQQLNAPSVHMSHRTSRPVTYRQQNVPGTPGQPYRMSDVLQNINIGGPTGFHNQTDPNNPANAHSGENAAENAAGNNASSSETPYNPLNSTYLYSVDQLHRHGLASHEVDEQNQAAQSRYSAGTNLAEDPYDEDMLENMEPVARARARFAYEARTSDGEIPFNEGEIHDVCDMTGNWWYCRRQNGEVGICPRNYLELLDEPVV